MRLKKGLNAKTNGVRLKINDNILDRAERMVKKTKIK